MDHVTREAIINEMNETLGTMLEKYDLDDIGIFEEQGEGNRHYLGYTVRKNGEVFMIHAPFEKNENGQFAPTNEGWTIESDREDKKGYNDLDEVFNYLELGF